MTTDKIRLLREGQSTFVVVVAVVDVAVVVDVVAVVVDVLVVVDVVFAAVVGVVCMLFILRA